MDFEVKSSEELENMSDEDQVKYETDLEEYTKENLDKELETEDEEETSDAEENLEEETKSDTSQEEENYKVRYTNLAKKFDEVTNELKQAKQVKVEEEPEKKDDIFDPEEYRELLDRDPKKAADYYYNTYVRPQMQQENQARTEEQQIKQAQETTIRSINEFGKLETVQKVMTEKPELGDEFGKFLRSHVQPPKNGYTVDDLQKAWNWFRYDDNVNEIKEQTKRDTVKQLNDADPEVVTLTNAKDSKATNSKNLKGKQQGLEYGEALSDEDLDKELEKRLGL